MKAATYLDIFFCGGKEVLLSVVFGSTNTPLEGTAIGVASLVAITTGGALVGLDTGKVGVDNREIIESCPDSTIFLC